MTDDNIKNIHKGRIDKARYDGIQKVLFKKITVYGRETTLLDAVGLLVQELVSQTEIFSRIPPLQKHDRSEADAYGQKTLSIKSTAVPAVDLLATYNGLLWIAAQGTPLEDKLTRPATVNPNILHTLRQQLNDLDGYIAASDMTQKLDVAKERQAILEALKNLPPHISM